MDVILQFIHNVRELATSIQAAFQWSGAVPKPGQGVGDSLKIILVDILRAILWGVGLVRELLTWLIGLIS